MSDSYYVHIPVNIIVKVPRNEYDMLSNSEHDNYLEQKIREQINLFGDEMHISIYDLNYADLTIDLD